MERLWRVRKNHTWIDAQLRQDGDEVAVSFSYDGERVLTRRFATRNAAIAVADATRDDLLRAGWTPHW